MATRAGGGEFVGLPVILLAATFSPLPAWKMSEKGGKWEMGAMPRTTQECGGMLQYTEKDGRERMPGGQTKPLRVHDRMICAQARRRARAGDHFFCFGEGAETQNGTAGQEPRVG